LKIAELISPVAISMALVAGSGSAGGERASVFCDAVCVLSMASVEAAPGGDAGVRDDYTWPAEPDSAAVERAEWVSLCCPVLVYGTSGALWEVLSTVRSFSMWYPHWKPERDMMRELTAPGDTIAYYLGDGYAGRSVVTWLEPLKELRVVHEGTSGEELGRVRMRIEPAQRGVGLFYEENVPAAGLDLPRERRLVCKRAFLIKRLAEGEG
jgi:hypothetical protein